MSMVLSVSCRKGNRYESFALAVRLGIGRFCFHSFFFFVVCFLLLLFCFVPVTCKLYCAVVFSCEKVFIQNLLTRIWFVLGWRDRPCYDRAATFELYSH